MIKIGIILGSTRPNRNGEAVAKWVYKVAQKRSAAEFELVNNKAAGFVSYGGASGARAVEQLRLNLAEVQMATVRNQVLLSMFTDFENFSVFKPGPTKEQSIN